MHLMVHSVLVVHKIKGPQRKLFLAHRLKAFCLIQGERWLRSSAKRLNELGEEVRQENVSCKQLHIKKAGQR